MHVQRHGVAILTGLCGLFQSELLFAQENQAQERVLDEVIVSAQRREESIQTVPVAITALTSDDIARFGMQTAGALVQQVPNVHFDAVGQSPRFTIRGIRMLNETDNNEPPIGFYRDDVYRGTWSAQMGQLFDIDRVEVLRGPQGTLFGRNATGGLIQTISRRPTRDFEGYTSVQLASWGSSADSRIVEGAVSGPFSDGVRGRLSFKYNDSDGWQKGCHDEVCADPIEIGKTDVLGVRGQLEVDLSASGSLLLIVEGVDQKSKSDMWSVRGKLDPDTLQPCSQSRIEANECVDAMGWGDPNRTPKKIYTTAADLPNNLKMISPSARLEWQFDGFDLTAISAYEHVKRHRVDDGIGGLGFAADPFPSAWDYWWNLEGDQYTQEIRLNGDVGSRLRWIAGAFYYDDEKSGHPAFENLLPIFGTYGWANDWVQQTESWAVFGQVDWQLTDAVTLTGGVRYTDEDRSLFITDSLAAPNFVANEHFSKGNVTGRGAIEWQINDDVMTYASIASGFKSASFNAQLVVDGQTAPVSPEELISYEVGIKSTLLDRRLRANLSAFYYDYDGIQQAALVTNDDAQNVSIRLFNIGKAKIYGLELELTAEIGSRFDASLGVGLMDSELDGVSDLQTSIDGHRLAESPKVSLNGYLRYRIPLGGNGEAALQTDFDYRSEAERSFENIPEERVAARTSVNVRAFWNSPGDRYYASVFVENLTDKSYARGWRSFDFAGLEIANYTPPRQIGAQFGVKF